MLHLAAIFAAFGRTRTNRGFHARIFVGFDKHADLKAESKAPMAQSLPPYRTVRIIAVATVKGSRAILRQLCLRQQSVGPMQTSRGRCK